MQSLWLVAGMAADPLLHIVVKLQGMEEQLCYMKASTLAVHVFKICKVRAKCQEGTLKDASGIDLFDDSTELSAGVYFFTPAEPTGRSCVSTFCQRSHCVQVQRLLHGVVLAHTHRNKCNSGLGCRLRIFTSLSRRDHHLVLDSAFE